MVFNTVTVGAAVTPTVIKTYVDHYSNRKSRAQKPTAHVSYDEGLHLIRQFLNYASYHTVEELQAFTSQWVPSPRWVRKEDVTIPKEMISKAADAIIAQLGHKGVDRVGGKTWWQWRRDDRPLGAEWIEMRADYNHRKKMGEPCKRVMLYIHGGAYFFGSVDEHRYQMQRHARKLKARVFAPRYRLSPQYPFPCAILDCLASYLYLLTMQDPSTILLAGDSAGAGMVVSILVILRDQGLPLPAGAVLISPWVDLTHSFPSVAAGSPFDYIPEHGFLQRPSIAWPPPNADDMRESALHAIEQVAAASLPRKSSHHERSEAAQVAIQGFSVDRNPQNLDPAGNKNNPTVTNADKQTSGNTVPGPGHDLSIMVDGNMVEIKDQIQMYASNQLISHPLVSPILELSLGGLPPLFIATGGGEVLRDEQIYLAHKAANPSEYLPGEVYLNEYANAQEIIDRYKPTDVQLQVWDDLCHVSPTLSFTRPAKFMYRSIAQFGAWALARAQKTEIEIMDDDDISIISSGSDTDTDSPETKNPKQQDQVMKNGVVEGGVSSTREVGKAGDPLPPFRNHMIRQRVDRNGVIYPLDPPSQLPALQMKATEVGIIKPGPVKKWMEAKKVWDQKFAKEKRSVQKERVKEMVKGYRTFGNDEVPPPSALAGRLGATLPKEKKNKRSMGMSLWSLWGSSHDKTTIDRGDQADKMPETTTANSGKQGANAQPRTSSQPNFKKSHSYSSHPRSKSRLRRVSDLGQTDHVDENMPAAELRERRNREAANGDSTNEEAIDDTGHLSPRFVPRSPVNNNTNNTSSKTQEDAKTDTFPQLILSGTNVTLDSPEAKRPKADGIAFPFKLGADRSEGGPNASMVTLMSSGVETPKAGEAEEKKELAVGADSIRGSETGDAEPADAGAVAGKPDEAKGADEKRPGVERFDTAREDLAS